MELFWKSASSIVLSVILILALGHQKDIATVLTICICCMVGICLLDLLKPVQVLVYTLQEQTSLDSTIIKDLFKLVGISLICEIAASVCSDAGCSSLGKSMQLLGSCVILYISIPSIQLFLNLIQEILGGL